MDKQNSETKLRTAYIIHRLETQGIQEVQAEEQFEQGHSWAYVTQNKSWGTAHRIGNTAFWSYEEARFAAKCKYRRLIKSHQDKLVKLEAALNELLAGVEPNSTTT